MYEVSGIPKSAITVSVWPKKNVSKERSHMVKSEGRVGLVSCSTRLYLVGVGDPL